MQVVIDIDEEEYINIKNAINSLIKNGIERASMSKVCLAILNGTPLPKGHGRLGDLDELEQRISNFVEHDAKITDEYTVTRQRFIVDGISETPTIIEADRNEKDKEL